LCCWLFQFNYADSGTSFFGNSTSCYTCIDSPANAYTSPSFAFSGGGGSDIITFSQAGVYVLFPVIFCSTGTLSEVAIIPSCTLTNVSVGNDSINNATLSDGRTVSFAYILSGISGEIAFPASSELTSLYGVNWEYSMCLQMFVHRLS